MGKYTYLFDLTRTLMGQLKVEERLQVEGYPYADIRRYGGRLITPPAQKLKGLLWEDLMEVVQEWTPETLGRVAALGRGISGAEQHHDPDSPQRFSLYHVHCGTWLDKYTSGKGLLQAIAVTTIIAAMADLVESSSKFDARVV